jgi:hypothetical protein
MRAVLVSLGSLTSWQNRLLPECNLRAVYDLSTENVGDNIGGIVEKVVQRVVHRIGKI